MGLRSDDEDGRWDYGEMYAAITREKQLKEELAQLRARCERYEEALRDMVEGGLDYESGCGCERFARAALEGKP